MKKTISNIKKITIIIIMITIMLVISSFLFDSSKHSIFGYNGFIVLSDSMKATDFDAGDLIIIKKVEFSDIKEGDIISYISQAQHNYMDIVTHKIRRITVNEEGEQGFITYGTTTGVDDEIIVTYPYIIGKYQFRIPKVGKILQFVKTTPGYIIFVLIPFLLLIFIQLINTVKSFKKYKRVHINKLELERKKLEQERKNIEQMMEELKRLKENETKNDSNKEDEN